VEGADTPARARVVFNTLPTLYISFGFKTDTYASQGPDPGGRFFGDLLVFSLPGNGEPESFETFRLVA
jgi:hypothetical protein